MANVATTRMSSKGQVVIPEAIRKRLDLAPGTQFIVLGEGDAVILKTVQPPSMKQFDSMIRAARRQAKAAGVRPSDVSKAVRRARGRK